MKRIDTITTNTLSVDLREIICMWTEEAICLWCDEITIVSGLTLPPSPTSLHGRKRGLSEMSSNVQKTPQKNKRIKKDADSLITRPASQDEENVDTPRPEHPLSTSIRFRPSITKAGVRNNAPYSNSVPSSQSDISYLSGSADSRGYKRRRSTSPTKQMEQQRYAKYPIRHLPVTNLNLVNDKIREAVKQVRRIGRAKGVLSSRYAVWTPLLSAGDDDLAEDIFDGGDDRYGIAPGIDRMRRIVERAANNLELSAAEAAWNSSVHCFLLEEALLGSSVERDLTWQNM